MRYLDACVSTPLRKQALMDSGLRALFRRVRPVDLVASGGPGKHSSKIAAASSRLIGSLVVLSACSGSWVLLRRMSLQETALESEGVRIHTCWVMLRNGVYQDALTHCARELEPISQHAHAHAYKHTRSGEQVK